jgi:hypothetical protein
MRRGRLQVALPQGLSQARRRRPAQTLQARGRSRRCSAWHCRPRQPCRSRQLWLCPSRQLWLCPSRQLWLCRSKMRPNGRLPKTGRATAEDSVRRRWMRLHLGPRSLTEDPPPRGHLLSPPRRARTRDLSRPRLWRGCCRPNCLLQHRLLLPSRLFAHHRWKS